MISALALRLQVRTPPTRMHARSSHSRSHDADRVVVQPDRRIHRPDRFGGDLTGERDRLETVGRPATIDLSGRGIGAYYHAGLSQVTYVAAPMLFLVLTMLLLLVCACRWRRRRVIDVHRLGQQTYLYQVGA